MKKVCIVTAARSEYGALRWLIDEVKNKGITELLLPKEIIYLKELPLFTSGKINYTVLKEIYENEIKSVINEN